MSTDQKTTDDAAETTPDADSFAKPPETGWAPNIRSAPAEAMGKGAPAEVMERGASSESKKTAESNAPENEEAAESDALGNEETAESDASSADKKTAENDAPREDAEVERFQEEIESLNRKVETLEEERDELNDRMLRKAAEFKNYRRRMDREKERRHKSGMLEVIEPMLEVLDDFERSIEAAEELQESEDPQKAYESLKGGVEMVFRKFQDSLENLGVKPIEAEGCPFDEEFHDAMMRQPSEEAEPGTVIDVIRKGYVMEDYRVIRHSRVVVAAEPPEENA